MALVWACRPIASPDSAAADITHAFEKDGVDAAMSKADAFFASNVRLDTVAVPRLCMLSITLAKLSESCHNDDYAAQALNCYRCAMRRDSVSATGFYEALAADDYQYVNLLRQLGGRADARTEGIYADEEAVSNNDSISMSK